MCVTIALHYATHRREKAKTLIRNELTEGTLSAQFFAEIFIHLSLILGFPVMIEGLEFLASFRDTRNVIHPLSRGRRKTGLRTLRRVYGNQTEPLLTNLRRIHPGLQRWIVTDVYGKVISRKGLSLQERELLNVTVLTVQGLEKQLYSHLRGALRVGVSGYTLKEVVQMTRRASTVNASVVREMIKELEKKRR
jgi:alkylhydroperoxidase/carboxymuconolactone decarboxylase family protein YurZ